MNKSIFAGLSALPFNSEWDGRLGILKKHAGTLASQANVKRIRNEEDYRGQADELQEASDAMINSMDEIKRARDLAAICYAGLVAECHLPEAWADVFLAASAGEPFTTDGLLPFVRQEPADNRCRHDRGEVGYDHWRCRDCGAFKTDSRWGVASNMYFNNRAEAEFYKKNGRLPENSEARPWGN